MHMCSPLRLCNVDMKSNAPGSWIFSVCYFHFVPAVLFCSLKLQLLKSKVAFLVPSATAGGSVSSE